jgi:hypothetical protein
MKKQYAISCLFLFACCLPAAAQHRYNRNEFSLHAGYANITSRVPGLTLNTPSYQGRLSSGVNYQFRYDFYASPQFTMGLLYDGFVSQSSHADGRDRLLNQYVGGTLGILPYRTDRWGIRLEVSLGEAFYRNNSIVYGRTRTVTGRSFAGFVGIIATRTLSRHWNVNLSAHYLFQDYGKLKVRYLYEPFYVKSKDGNGRLFRLALTGGLSYAF